MLWFKIKKKKLREKQKLYIFYYYENCFVAIFLSIYINVKLGNIANEHIAISYYFFESKKEEFSLNVCNVLFLAAAFHFL